MQLQGQVLDVRQSSFASKQDASKLIEMLYFDLYDDTAKVLPCEMLRNGVVVEKGMRVECEGTRIKATKFGNSGFLVVVRNVRELAPVVPIHSLAPPPPAPSAQRKS